MSPESARRDDILQYPCQFPVKIMGYNRPEFRVAMLEVVRQHAPDASEGATTHRFSADKKYISLTVTITAQSRDQLDALYLAITRHEWVLVAL